MSERFSWADFNRMENPPPDRECPDCGRDFTPTPDNEKFCVGCNARFESSFKQEYLYGHYDDMAENFTNPIDGETGEEIDECDHTQGEPGSLVDCVNPYSGKCCRCGKQVRPIPLTIP